MISPYNSIDYYEAVVAKLGGEGADSFDGLDTLTRWVEQGSAPEKLTAAKLADGKIVRTRPLCPYPQVARYRGSGSTDDHASFECVRT